MALIHIKKGKASNILRMITHTNKFDMVLIFFFTLHVVRIRLNCCCFRVIQDVGVFHALPVF